MHVFFALLLLVTSHAQATPTPALVNLLKQAYDPNITFFHSIEKHSVDGCPQGRTFISGKDPWTHKNRDIELNEYAPLGGKSANRAVIIMPPTGGENVIDEEWGNVLCQAGFRAVIVRSFELFPESGIALTMYDHTALTSLVAIRQTIDYLNKSGSQSVGILGASLGAIEASFAAVIDDRLKTGVFIVGGLGLAQIAATSNEAGEKKLRQEREELWHLNNAQYAETLRKAVHIDVVPFIDATLPQRKKILSVIAMEDTTVPTANQMRLYNAFGRQQVIPVEHDHVATVARALFHSYEMIDFFNQNL